MKTLNLFLSLFTLLFLSSAFSQKMAAPYLDHLTRECVFSYNSNTGTSTLFYHKPSEKKFLVSSYQLPHAPIGDGAIYRVAPYLDHLGRECVLVWDINSGVSKIFYHKPSEKKFLVSSYQLPIMPLGEGIYQFSPYLDHLGRECVLVSNSKNGDSKIYFHKPSDSKFIESPYQLPANPTGDEGVIGFTPYLDHLNRECVLVYNKSTGTSKIFYHKPSEKNFLVSSYQLPTKPTEDEGSYGFAPYLDHLGRECVLCWNYKTGTSKIFYHRPSDKKFLVSSYQLPTKPTGDDGKYGFAPYLDHLGRECVLTWNIITGTSKLFYHRPSDKKFLESSYQLKTID